MELQINVKVLKELFKNKEKYRISEKRGHTGVPDNPDDGGSQGEYNETFVYYRHPDMPNNVFVQETHHTDSYGCNPSIINIDFVQGKEKTITIFEPL